MTQLFKLERAGAYGSITPGSGEDLGGSLSRFATAEEERYRANPQAKVMYWASTVAQVLYLAGEAFEQGASASLGHNRADRYMTQAKELRGRAEALEAEAASERQRTLSARLMVAFQDGYEGLKGDRYSFDDRKAFLIGKHFADEGMEIPELIMATTEGGFDVDGELYEVDYPSGKISEAVVSKK